MPTPFAQKLLPWYRQNARQLPWRGHPDPYAVWVSEIMLQQTRVETVIPYFKKWLQQYPTVEVLAAADQQEVLNLWEGLGYYSRARNLHRAAQIVVENYGSHLPKTKQGLQELPGIGPYTAAAIASIAFGQDEPALDGNIRRVLSRVFNITDPLQSPAGEKVLKTLARENLYLGQAGDYNQAVMDLGATLCTPKKPNCPECPLASLCRAKALGVQGKRPVPRPRPEIPHHTVAAAIIQCAGKIMIAQRPQKGLLGGMWEFPGGKREEGEDLLTCLRREIREELEMEIQVGAPFGVYQHTYSHFKVTLHAFLCTLNGDQPQLKEHTDLRWVEPGELGDFPMGKIDRQIANQLTKTIPSSAPANSTCPLI